MRRRAATAALHAGTVTQTSTRCQRCGLLFFNRAIPHQKAAASQNNCFSQPRHRTSEAVHTRGGGTTAAAAGSPPPPPNMAVHQLPGRPMVAQCAYISYCACFGTLARLYTDNINPSNLALQGSLLSNSLGSFALGALVASDLNEESMPGLYAGLTVGLCGSYTTYSGWNLRIARAALQDASGPGGAIVAIVAIVKSLAFFAACFVAGGDLVRGLARRGRTLRWQGPGGNSAFPGRAIGSVAVVYALLAVLMVVDGSRTRRIRWLACMFAPFGALLRFFLSRQYNNRWREGAFPVGTFSANVCGSLIMGLVYYGATHKYVAGWSGIALAAFQGGFLGSLTTMSSFMSEVVGHREKHSPLVSYSYLAATAVAAQVLVLIVGAVLGN